MFGFIATQMALGIQQGYEEHKARIKLWDSMPTEQAEKSKADYYEQRRIEDEHRKALEIAKALRTKNWIETLFGT